jgi:hypothetical protein
VEWLAFSIVASVVLTVLLNVGLRLFPSAGRGLSQWLAERAAPGPGPSDGEPERRVRVIAPWRAMLVASLVLTVVLNLVLALAR